MKNIFISVIIIAKNEEERVGRCFDSVMKLRKKYSTEIIFVDSASSDKTIDIALKYPIQIYRISKSKYLNPSAGRYVGFPHAKGEYVLFIDGDSILIEGFVEKALSILKSSDVAAVAGKRIFRKMGESLRIKEKITGKMREYNTIGGTGIYKRKILEAVGTFNPHMGGQEERELCFRIRQNGYKIIKVDIPMEYHINKNMDIMEATERAGYFIGVGQIIRRYGFKKITWELLYDQKKALFETLIVTLSPIWILLSIIFQWPVLIVGSLIIIAGIVLLSLFKGPSKVFVQFRARFTLFYSIIKGILKGIDEPKSFDKKVTVKRIK